MTVRSAVAVVLPEPMGYQRWAGSTATSVPAHRVFNVRLVLVTLAIVFGLVAGILLAPHLTG